MSGGLGRRGGEAVCYMLQPFVLVCAGVPGLLLSTGAHPSASLPSLPHSLVQRPAAPAAALGLVAPLSAQSQGMPTSSEGCC